MIKEIKTGEVFYYTSGSTVRKAVCKATKTYDWGLWIEHTSNGGLKDSIAYHTRAEAEERAKRYQIQWRKMLHRSYMDAKKNYEDFCKEMEKPLVFVDEVSDD